jgi:N-acetylglucosamine kinase-like BadF-type ATPase
MGSPQGIGVVVGTGSIAVSRDERDELLTAGGWGWILGDEGSAAGLVREAVRMVLRRIDDGAEPDTLVRRLFTAFGVEDGPQLAMALSRDSSAHGWGGYAPEVFLAADEGSVQAHQVIRDAGEQLAQLIVRLRHRGVTSRDVVAGGSVIASQPRLRAAFADALAATDAGARLSILSSPPVLGALALAQSIAAAGAPAQHDNRITSRTEFPGGT